MIFSRDQVYKCSVVLVTSWKSAKQRAGACYTCVAAGKRR